MHKYIFSSISLTVNYYLERVLQLNGIDYQLNLYRLCASHLYDDPFRNRFDWSRVFQLVKQVFILHQ
jgi:hypothetical protein